MDTNHTIPFSMECKYKENEQFKKMSFYHNFFMTFKESPPLANGPKKTIAGKRSVGKLGQLSGPLWTSVSR